MRVFLIHEIEDHGLTVVDGLTDCNAVNDQVDRFVCAVGLVEALTVRVVTALTTHPALDRLL